MWGLKLSKKLVVVGLAVAAIVLCGLLYVLVRPRVVCDLKLPQGCVMIERVATEQTRAQGLSNRSSLPADQAMLFVYDTPGDYCFWMKDM